MVPEQEVPDELVVTEVVSIGSEKITTMDEFNDIPVALFDGLVDATVGEVVSGFVSIFAIGEYFKTYCWELDNVSCFLPAARDDEDQTVQNIKFSAP